MISNAPTSLLYQDLIQELQIKADSLIQEKFMAEKQVAVFEAKLGQLGRSEKNKKWQ